jgi:hypothetical protein
MREPFKKGALLKSIDTYEHPFYTQYPNAGWSTKNCVIYKNEIVEVMKDEYEGALDLWIPRLNGFTCGTFASHYEKISS